MDSLLPTSGCLQNGATERVCVKYLDSEDTAQRVPSAVRRVNAAEGEKERDERERGRESEREKEVEMQKRRVWCAKRCFGKVEDFWGYTQNFPEVPISGDVDMQQHGNGCSTIVLLRSP